MGNPVGVPFFFVIMKLVQLQNGVNLNIQPVYADLCDRADTVLIFIHEALGSIGQWKGFPQQLCNTLGLNGIVYEREGYGGSSALREGREVDYLNKYAWEELPELLKIILPSDKKVILVGHSDGASIALLYGSKFPERVTGIVSMAAHVIVENETIEGILPAVSAFQAGKLDGLRKYHGDKTDSIFYAWSNIWLSQKFRKWNICDDIRGIQSPVLLMQGDKDQYGTIQQLALIKQAISHEEVSVAWIKDCGHIPFLQQTEIVLDYIYEWKLKKGL